MLCWPKGGKTRFRYHVWPLLRMWTHPPPTVASSLCRVFTAGTSVLAAGRSGTRLPRSRFASTQMRGLSFSIFFCGALLSIIGACLQPMPSTPRPPPLRRECTTNKGSSRPAYYNILRSIILRTRYGGSTHRCRSAVPYAISSFTNRWMKVLFVFRTFRVARKPSFQPSLSAIPRVASRVVCTV